MARRTLRAALGSRDKLILISASTTVTLPTTSSSGVQMLGDRPHYNRWLCKIRSTDGTTSSAVVAPKLYGWDGVSWYLVKALNSAGNVTVAAQQYCEVVDNLGLFERVAFGATSAGAAIDVELVPVLES